MSGVHGGDGAQPHLLPRPPQPHRHRGEKGLETDNGQLQCHRSSLSSTSSVTMPPFTDRGAKAGQHIRDVRRDHDAGNQKTQ